MDKRTGHLIVDLERQGLTAVVDKILEDVSIADLLAFRLSHSDCEKIIYRQYLNDKTRFEHYINTLSLYSRIKFRTYAFFEPQLPVTETRHNGKYKQTDAKYLTLSMKRMKLNSNDSTSHSSHRTSEDENTQQQQSQTLRVTSSPSSNSSIKAESDILSNSDRDSGVDVNEQRTIAQIERQKVEAEKRRELDNRSVFVGNVDYHCSPDDIRYHFQMHCGLVKRVTFIKDYTTNQFKGYCFVEFENTESVHHACQLSGHRLRNRELRVRSKRTNMPGMQRITN